MPSTTQAAKVTTRPKDNNKLFLKLFRCLLKKENLIDQITNNILKEAYMISCAGETYVSGKRGSKRGRLRDKLHDRDKKKNAFSQSRSRSHSEFRGRRTPSLLMRADHFGPSSSTMNTAKCPVHYISLHDLPNARSYSYQDDTRSDSIEDLIQTKIEQMQRRSSDKQLAKSMDFFRDSQSPLSSEKGPEKAASTEMILDLESEYDSMQLLSTQNIRLPVDFEGLLSKSFTEKIIGTNLKHHLPDDLDVESLTICVLPTKPKTVFDDLQPLDLNADNLSLFVTSLYLKKTTLL